MIAKTSFTVPKSVKTIYGAFISCNSLFGDTYGNVLEEILVEEGNQYFKSENGILYSADGKTLIAYPRCKEGISFTVPSTTENISTSAFGCAAYLTEIVLNEGIKTINSYAFESTKITEMIIPASIEYMGEWLFEGCQYIESVTILANIPPEMYIGNSFEGDRIADIFGNGYYGAIYVPEESIDAYYEVPGWSDWYYIDIITD